MKYSIIIPAYNEEKRISATLKDYCTYFSHFPKKETEILVVLNGCRDNTLSIVQQFAKKYSLLRYVNIPEAIGKGGAVIEGFRRAKGDFVGYADADDATQAQYYHDLIKQIGDADGIIASRWMKGAVVEPKQPFSRRFASRCFNFLIHILFGLPFHDTQCGCKMFRAEALRKILPSLGMTRWAFDIDVLYHLKRQGFFVKEIPTVWKDRIGSSILVSRVSVEMFFAIVRLRLLYSPFKFLISIYNRIAAALGIKF